ncbi:MAG TPA: hypothetical protein VFQ67_16830 [Allosphingosinicella sp.]|jgi:hypothetical protein|nr:hypothetical protein [Allosphingosinicella sp.]
MMGLLLGMAMLIPPPEPPPPPDRLAAAAELRRLAPFSAGFRDHAFDRAIWRAASKALRGGEDSRYADLVGEAKGRIEAKLAASRSDIDARADGCLDVRLGHGFDLAALREMAKVVPTTGGYALWEQAMREPAQACYDESVEQALVGFTSAISWLAGKGLLQRLPRHDLRQAPPPALIGELETLCGRRSRGAVEIRNGSVGIAGPWADREARRRRNPDDTMFCLLVAAKVSGFEPVIFRP